MPSLSQIINQGSGGGSSGGASIPLGSFVDMPSDSPNVITTEGKTYLKSGVVALASVYPNVPSTLVGNIHNAITRQTTDYLMRGRTSGGSASQNANTAIRPVAGNFTNHKIATNGAGTYVTVSAEANFARYVNVSTNSRVTWRKVNIDNLAGQTCVGLVWWNNAFYLIASSGTAYKSLNGVDWTLAFSFGIAVQGVRVYDGKLIGRPNGSSSLTYFPSTVDGSVVSITAIAGLPSATYVDIAYNGTRWVAVANTTAIRHSTSPTSGWATVNSPTGNGGSAIYCSSIVTSGGAFSIGTQSFNYASYFIYSNLQMGYSADGITWTWPTIFNSNSPQLVNSEPCRLQIMNGVLFVQARGSSWSTSAGQTYWWTSTNNGSTWSAFNATTASWVWNNGSASIPYAYNNYPHINLKNAFLLSGTGDDFLWDSTLSNFLMYRHANWVQAPYALNYGGSYYGMNFGDSMEGLAHFDSTYTLVNIPYVNGDCRTYTETANNGSGLIVATAGFNQINQGGLDYGNGKNFRQYSSVYEPKYVSEQGSTLAVLGNSYATSSDNGKTWTRRSFPQLGNWGSICFANGYFYAIQSESFSFNAANWYGEIALVSNVWRSADGINWTQVTLPGSNLNGIGMAIAIRAYGNSIALIGVPIAPWTTNGGTAQYMVTITDDAFTTWRGAAVALDTVYKAIDNVATSTRLIRNWLGFEFDNFGVHAYCAVGGTISNPVGVFTDAAIVRNPELLISTVDNSGVQSLNATPLGVNSLIEAVADGTKRLYCFKTPSSSIMQSFDGKLFSTLPLNPIIDASNTAEAYAAYDASTGYIYVIAGSKLYINTDGSCNSWSTFALALTFGHITSFKAYNNSLIVIDASGMYTNLIGNYVKNSVYVSNAIGAVKFMRVA